MSCFLNLIACLAVTWALLTMTAPVFAQTLGITQMRCEYRVNPTGLDVREPRLSWILTSQQRGAIQTGYQILVASSREALARHEGDLWDSGRVASDQTIHILYAGKPLLSRQEAWWKVRAWDKDGLSSEWSTPARWVMGLLERSDWQAQWIGAPEAKPASIPPHALAATLTRKSFSLPKSVRRATAYASALGLYELRLNGQRVGDQLLAPEWTSYRRRVSYQTYDVTDLLHPGENVAAAFLGEGWYAGTLMVVGRFAYGTTPRFLLQIEIELTDGSTQTWITDGSWRISPESPLPAAGIYDGETYDARQDPIGWQEPGYNDSHWPPAQTMGLDGRRLVWLPNEPIRIVQELSPVHLSEPRPGTYIFDLGQNMVGWCRIQAEGLKGRTVTIRHAEMLNDDGTLYTANLRGAPQVDRYTPRTDGPFTFEPRFTYHGFRYVELTGLASSPATNAVTGRVFHSTSPEVSHFECSDVSINRLMENVLWTQRANLMSSPNDCPQRDERFGWMGDIQAFSQTAIFNMDMAAFFTKFAQDTRDDQAKDGRFPDFAPHPGDPNRMVTDGPGAAPSFAGAPAWADAGVIVPWRAYQNYADTRILADQFDAARAWVEYVRRLNPNLVWTKGRNNDYNDWLNGDTLRQAGWPTHGGSIPNSVFATAFFAHSTELVAKMAAVLGRTDDARQYQELFQQIKIAFNQAFVEPEGKIEGGTQAGYALALHFDLLPSELRPNAARLLTNGIQHYQNHLSTGIQSTHRAMLELVRYGYADLGWQLLTNRTFPSWLYMVDNGATTIWERWDGYVKGRGFQDAGMNSFNHWAFGAVGEWVWRNVAGLNPDDTQPGWKRFILAPRPGGGVSWTKSRYQSIRGEIVSNWQIKNRKFHWELAIPPNTTASIRVPSSRPDEVLESGRPVTQVPEIHNMRIEPGAVIFEVASGRFIIESPIGSVAAADK